MGVVYERLSKLYDEKMRFITDLERNMDIQLQIWKKLELPVDEIIRRWYEGILRSFTVKIVYFDRYYPSDFKPCDFIIGAYESS